jgi:hypothetical protein
VQPTQITRLGTTEADNHVRQIADHNGTARVLSNALITQRDASCRRNPLTVG